MKLNKIYKFSGFMKTRKIAEYKRPPKSEIGRGDVWAEVSEWNNREKDWPASSFWLKIGHYKDSIILDAGDIILLSEVIKKLSKERAR
jgi:hypothetical protein